MYYNNRVTWIAMCMMGFALSEQASEVEIPTRKLSVSSVKSTPNTTPTSSRRSSLSLPSSQVSTPFSSPGRSFRKISRGSGEEEQFLMQDGLSPLSEQPGDFAEYDDRGGLVDTLLLLSEADSEKKKHAPLGELVKSSSQGQSGDHRIMINSVSSNSVISPTALQSFKIEDKVRTSVVTTSLSMDEQDAKQRARIGRLVRTSGMFCCKEVEPNNFYILCARRSPEGAIMGFTGMRLCRHTGVSWELQKELRSDERGLTGCAAMTSWLGLGASVTLSWPIMPFVTGAVALASSLKYCYFKEHPLTLYRPAAIPEHWRGPNCRGFQCLEAYNVAKTTAQGQQFEALHEAAVQITDASVPTIEDNVYFLPEADYATCSQRFFGDVLEGVADDIG